MGKGYKATYSLLEAPFIFVNDENINDLPEDLKKVVVNWKYKADRYRRKYKDNKWYCPVKSASEQFRYNDVNYVMTPELFDATSDFFEYLMLSGCEDDLVEIGAEAVFCNAMID
jgi:hypothetical protein